MVIDSSPSVCPTQLNSNVVSLDSHVGQYAVICEKQHKEVPRRRAAAAVRGGASTRQSNFHRFRLELRLLCFVGSQIVRLKQKLKEYEEGRSQNPAPGGPELTWSRKQAEFKQ